MNIKNEKFYEIQVLKNLTYMENQFGVKLSPDDIRVLRQIFKI